jgi:NTE family protein
MRAVPTTTTRIRHDSPDRLRGDNFPTLAQIAGHVMNSIFLDSLSVDIERLERINRTVSCSAPEALKKMGLSLHHVDVLVLTPSEPLDQIAIKHMPNLPWTIRFMLRSVGAMRHGGANLASYLLFEQSYCQELIELGYNDTIKRREEVEAFLAGGLSIVPGSYARTVRFMVPLPTAKPAVAEKSADG